MLFLYKFIEENMLVDILSDTHFDSWFGYNAIPNEDMVVGFWRSLKPKGDYLVLAGDIGHNIMQNIHILSILKKVFYKEIIITLGNHDYFLVGFNILETPNDKAKKSKKLYQHSGILVLDGNVVELEGIKFGGAMGWYNDAYIVKNRFSLLGIPSNDLLENLDSFINHIWQSHPDCKGTKLGRYDELFEEEYMKLTTVHQSCDVMVSHFNPSIKMEFQTKGWQKDPTSTFFCFDGEELAIKTTARLWIYGHTHERKMYIWHNKKFVTSALGYRSEHYKGKIVTREIV